MFVDIVPVAVMTVFHAVCGFFFNGFDGIEQFDGGGFFFAHGVQDIFYPCVIFATGIDEQVAVLDGLDIPWRRLVGMAFHAGFEQHGDIGLAAGYFLGEVVLRENGGHDAQPVCCGRRFLCAGIACRQTGDGQHGYGQK